MKDFSINPVPLCRYILISLTTPRRVSHSCDNVKKIDNRAENLNTSGTFWSHLYQKLVNCKKSKKLKSGTKWKRKIVLSCPYILKIMLRLLWPHETVLQTSATKHPKSKSCKLLFGWCCCFRAYRLIIAQWNIKKTVPCKRWENFLSVTYIFELALLLFEKFTHTKGGCFQHQATCLVCFGSFNQLFINLGKPSDHAFFLHKQCKKFDASSDVSYSWHQQALKKKKKKKKKG